MRSDFSRISSSRLSPIVGGSGATAGRHFMCNGWNVRPERSRRSRRISKPVGLEQGLADSPAHGVIQAVQVEVHGAQPGLRVWLLFLAFLFGRRSFLFDYLRYPPVLEIVKVVLNQVHRRGLGIKIFRQYLATLPFGIQVFAR